MKRCMAIVCMMIALRMFGSAVYAEGTMYPHPDVAMELTMEEDTVTAESGREWKKLSGTAVRPDMEHGELRYEVYLPAKYSSKKEYPVLLYLHGGDLGYKRSAGETSWSEELNGWMQIGELVSETIEDCIIFAPQAPGAPKGVRVNSGSYWSMLASGMVGTATTDNSESSPYLRAAEKMMADFLEKGISHGGEVYTVDSSRLYVTGHSMGAIGTYTVLRDCPDMFAAAIIGAGIGDPDTVKAWKDTPVRIFHGTWDRTIPIKPSELIAEALQKANARDAVFTPLERTEHDIEGLMFLPKNDEGKSEIFSWMAKQRLGKADSQRTFLYVGIAVVIAVLLVVTVMCVLKKRRSKA
ncbi:MAG: hypothetical protein E7390_04860 [Ruminococcaceae bacterium]|nr:hypothetical protein [Oscillospiraceae bacterium]